MTAHARHREARRHNLLILAGLLALAAIALAVAFFARDPQVEARPALWHIAKGDRQGWLFGTIHAVPSGAQWLSPAVERAIEESDGLVLEAEGLAAERSDRAVFESLGRSPGLQPLAARVEPRDRRALAALKRAAPAALAGIDGYEDWAAALLIGAASNGLAGVTNAQAPEARLESLFRKNGRTVTGLETVRDQLGLFDALPPPVQKAMLEQSIEEASDAARMFDRLYAAWASGDLAALENEYLKPLERYPALRDSLIERRNAIWARAIDKGLGANGRVWFIAVGTGHLIGENGLPGLLARDGWTVTRMQ